MKKNKVLRVIISFLAWIITASFLSKLLMPYGIAPGISMALLLMLTVLSVLTANRNREVVTNAVDAEIWVREIIKRLWKNNAFLARAFNEDSYVLGGAVVHIINPAGQLMWLKTDLFSPGVAARRTDTDVTYTLGDYSTDPIHIPDVELATITYDKTSSIIQDLFGYLMQYVADDQLVNWMQAIPAVNIVPTTGPTTAALEAGQTGNRLAMLWQDLRNAGRIMSKANVPETGRVALIEENMYQQLVDSLANTQYRDFSRAYDEKTGVIGKLFKFDIMTRSSVAIAAAGGGALSINAVGAAIGATDNVACLCYQEETVSRALGTVEMYQRAKDPLYYGDVFSTRLRMGGRRRRGDDLGVVAIVQAPDAGV